ncbi:hypothetical protein HPB47_017328 [Ixodes persulcatus]|uniref:Uncharacterized protein n=1 Tax=Ixodes persulcatus TaxID=34615 RepID=A0AC60QQZ0_IXOPE|nr:hypothetical protein HPB47_017328 [Ixodes persulcatus]
MQHSRPPHPILRHTLGPAGATNIRNSKAHPWPPVPDSKQGRRFPKSSVSPHRRKVLDVRTDCVRVGGPVVAVGRGLPATSSALLTSRDFGEGILRACPDDVGEIGMGANKGYAEVG